MFGSGGSQALCILGEEGKEDYSFTSSTWPYLGEREGSPGEDPGASCLWAPLRDFYLLNCQSRGILGTGTPQTSPQMPGNPVWVGLPFNGGCVPLGPGLQRGAEPSRLDEDTQRGSASGLTGLGSGPTLQPETLWSLLKNKPNKKDMATPGCGDT